MESLEALGLESRLARGRSYARSGQVLSLNLEPGQIQAQVQGSARNPYEGRIQLTSLSEAQWKRFFAVLGDEPGVLARLLAGELPPETESVLEGARVSLFPTGARELKMACSCPDYEVPCKHLAAVCCLVAEELDRDPFGLLLLRGKGRDEILTALLGAAPVAPPPTEPLSLDPGVYWSGLPESLPGFGRLQPPALTAPVIRRLGPFPLWRVETPLADSLAPVLDAAAQRLADPNV
jgi:uncharacterized Zn finger protein